MGFSELLAVADRAVRGHLGSTIRYAPEFQAPADVPGIFDAAFLRASVEGAAVLSSVPAVFVLLADLRAAFGATYDALADKPRITVGGVEYRVREAQPDGQGAVVLFLSEV